MIHTKNISIDVQYCDFCGTIHPNYESVKAHGCLKGEPEQKLEEGNEVIARFSVGSGIESVGHTLATGKIVKVIKPSELPQSLTTIIRFQNVVGISNQLQKHEWFYEVEPFKKELENNKFIINQIFPSSELIKK